MVGTVASSCLWVLPDGLQEAFKAHIGRFAYTSSSLEDRGEFSEPATMPPKRKIGDTETAMGGGVVDAVGPRTSPGSTPRKRESDIATDQEHTPKKRRRSAKERSANDPHDPENNLVDSLRPGMILVICGLNPGLQTAATGHAYSHKSNVFWRLLHESGVTPIRHPPSDTHKLPDLYNIGNTNICARPTRDGSGLSKEELAEGAKILEDKMREYRPEVVAIVGKGIWEALWLARTGKKLKASEFKYGWQQEETWLGKEVLGGEVTWKGSRVFVTTTTSGLAAGMKPHEKLEVWKPLGEWVKARREELSKDGDGGGAGEVGG